MEAVKRGYNNVAQVVDAQSSEEAQNVYLKWAKDYNEDVRNLEEKVPANTARVVMKLCPDSSKVRILDIATGTGLLGVELKNIKFKGKIDGIDANKDMLEIAKKTGIYSKLTKQFISPEGKIDAEYEAYDFVTCIGALLANHVPPSSVKYMIPHLKKGGIFIYSIRTTKANAQYKKEVDRIMQALVEREFIQFIEEKDVTHFGKPNPTTGEVVTSSLFLYQKC